MSTILQNKVAPLWVWILVIVIGSLFVILLLIYLVQRFVSRRRRNGTDLEAHGPPVRRLTVQNGRVVSKNDNAAEKSRLLHDSTRPDTSGSEDQPAWQTKEKVLSGSPSTTDSSGASPSTLRYSKAPRLSLGSFDAGESFDGFSSESDLTVISKPSTAVINEPQKQKPVNFSRPQVRAPVAAPTKKSRLSVINEYTPRNSFINRIVSWASNSNDTESRLSQQPEVAERAPHINLAFAQSREDLSNRPSPLLDALQELQRLSDAPTPELPCKNPSRTVSLADDATLVMGSRTSSTYNPYKHSHKRSDSSTNFSRKGPYTSHSRSSSMSNFSRPHQLTTHSRTTSASSVEEPQATLSGPFDALEAMMGRESVTSVYSDEPRAESRAIHPSPDDTSTINTDFLLSGRTSATPSTSSYVGMRRERSRSRSRSRGPTKTVNKRGQTVLRKRSLQTPEITMIGPVDPSALENLSVADS